MFRQIKQMLRLKPSKKMLRYRYKSSPPVIKYLVGLDARVVLDGWGCPESGRFGVC